MPKAKPEPKSERNQPFIEDFNMEHCCSGVTAALMAFSASAESPESGKTRNPYAQPMNPPTCVYLG
jgi:hypothetical protein